MASVGNGRRRGKSSPIGTPSKRKELPVAKNPLWETVGDQRSGLALGYRRRTSKAGTGKAGVWVVRLIHEGRRAEKNLAPADDADAPQEDGALSYTDATTEAGKWAKWQRAAWTAAEGGTVEAPTVEAAVEAYVTQRKRKAGTGGRDAELRLGHHVLAAPLAKVRLADLDGPALRAWRAGLHRGGKAARKAAKAPAKGRAAPSAAPLTPSTVNRLLNDLRAALNLAGRTHRRLLPPAFGQLVEDELRGEAGADEPRGPQLLPDADVRRLVDAAFGIDADFGALVLVLAATGTRFGQAVRLTVADVQPGLSRIMVPVARKGRSDRTAGTTRKPAHVAVPLGPDVVARLQPLLSGRRGHEPLLTRWHHRQIQGDKAAGTLPRWERVERRAWKDAAEMARPWRAALEAAGLPADMVPYALRHSSIVRGLKAGLPLRLVAALHDTSAAMIERTYSAFIVDAAEDLARQAVVALAPATVAPLRKVGI